MGGMVIFIIVLLFLLKGLMDDIYHRSVKDVWTLGLVVIIMVLNHADILPHGTGLIIGSMVGYLGFHRKWWGGADMKLMMAMGAYFGYPGWQLPLFLIILPIMLCIQKELYIRWLRLIQKEYIYQRVGIPAFLSFMLAFLVVHLF